MNNEIQKIAENADWKINNIIDMSKKQIIDEAKKNPYFKEDAEDYLFDKYGNGKILDQKYDYNKKEISITSDSYFVVTKREYYVFKKNNEDNIIEKFFDLLIHYQYDTAL